MKTGSGKTREPSMPFSNGTEGYGWMANWCDRCIHDKPAREDRYEDACAILTQAMCNDGTPIEWIDGPRDERGLYSIADQYHCIEFRSEDEGPPPRTEPLSTPPGQGELIPMDPYVGTRMFSDVVAEVAPHDTDLAEPDHATCEHNGGCDVVLCYCGNPDLCPGTEQPQCGHHWFLCSAHAHVDCDDCAVDAAVERAHAYARDEGWTG